MAKSAFNLVLRPALLILGGLLLALASFALLAGPYWAGLLEGVRWFWLAYLTLPLGLLAGLGLRIFNQVEAPGAQSLRLLAEQIAEDSAREGRPKNPQDLEFLITKIRRLVYQAAQLAWLLAAILIGLLGGFGAVLSAASAGLGVGFGVLVLAIPVGLFWGLRWFGKQAGPYRPYLGLLNRMRTSF